MKHLRYWVPVLGALALAALFLMLPETPSIACKACSSGDPYVPLIGAGYFSILIALSLLFPSFPGVNTARGGLTWSILLAFVMTYIRLPDWCPFCLVAHVCHILIWAIWVIVPLAKNPSRAVNFRERLCLLLFVPLSVIALFSSLNLTFMAYGFKNNRPIFGTSLQRGDKAPIFATNTVEGHTITNPDAASAIVINFVSADCPHCKEQLLVLNDLVNQLGNKSYRFVNVCPVISPELLHFAPAFEWIEDKEGDLRKLFKVTGTPMLFVIGSDGKIVETIAGVSEQLKPSLIARLTNG